MIRLRLTDKEVKAALKALTIQIDVGDMKKPKQIEHITKWFDTHKKPYKKMKIDYGDYCAFIPKGTIKGVDYDIVFDKEIVIERKKSLDELAMNFSAGDNPRLKKEFAHIKAYNTKVYVFVEDALFDKHLRNHNYKSQYDPKRFFERMKGFEAEYNTIIRPVSAEYIASEIYHTLYYHARHYLLREFKVSLEE